MRKVVGTLFVAAVLACGSRAQAEPLHLGQFSGLDGGQDRTSQNMWKADDNGTASVRFTTEVRQRLSTCRDDDDVSAFVSYVRSRWSSAMLKWEKGDDRPFPFMNGMVHGHMKAEKVARFWEKMHSIGTNRAPHTWDRPDVAATPEPASMILLGSGLVGLFGLRRRKD
jgi:PEP-CTERM motif